jgi:hypothetical protein
MTQGVFPHHTLVHQSPETKYRVCALSAFDEPFFNEAWRAMGNWESPPGRAENAELLDLCGFIFHSAHCGSTLLSRMLSHSGAFRTVNESDAINGLLLSYLLYDLEEEKVIAHIQEIVHAYRIIPENRRGLLFKLSSWNVLMLDLFRKAFPEVPWMYLFRDEESLIPSLLQSGQGFVTWYDLPSDHMVRSILPKEIPLPDKTSYLREVSRKQWEIVQSRLAEKGLTCRYPDFLEEFDSRILPHFGLTLSKEELNKAQEMRRYDAKTPGKVHYGLSKLTSSPDAHGLPPHAADSIHTIPPEAPADH